MQQDYDAFVEKFKRKKTTDDCYTPPVIYDVIAEWVANEYGVNRAQFVRPFYPGGDYENYEYAPDSIVVDNPPFSIISQIIRVYTERGIRFFLFSPNLTQFNAPYRNPCACICTGVNVTYENGAQVSTSFCTNLEPPCIRSAPDLYQLVTDANNANLREGKTALPSYVYPDNVVTSTKIGFLSRWGVPYKIGENEFKFTRKLDAQRPHRKAIFGAGALISDDAAAEYAEAHRQACYNRAIKPEKDKTVIQWELSDAEREIIAGLKPDGVAE